MVSEEDLHDVQRGRQPRFVYVPALAAQRLVGDLDRVMTVEKAMLRGWSRTVGCVTDEERRDFAQAVARKRRRFAFPDDFNRLAAPLQKRLIPVIPGGLVTGCQPGAETRKTWTTVTLHPAAR